MGPGGSWGFFVGIRVDHFKWVKRLGQKCLKEAAPILIGLAELLL
jgi:hypothetical protein